MDFTFHERQRMNQWWIRIFSILVAGLAVHGVVWQVVLGRPFGDHPASNAEVLAISAVMLLGVLFVRSIRLDTMVDEEGLHIRLWPFLERHISLDQVVEAQVTAYKGVGAGLRLGTRHGTVYNLTGREGVQIQLSSGERVYLGSRHARRLLDALEKKTTGV